MMEVYLNVIDTDPFLVLFEWTFDISILKECEDDNSYENGRKFSKRVENTVGKRRNCS